MEIAIVSLWKSRLLSALMIVAMGLGIGASMTMMSVVHVLSGDPLPERSHELFIPHIDPLPLGYRSNRHGDPSENFTWPDARALIAAHRADAEAAMAGGHVLVTPAQGEDLPFDSDGRFVTAGFFPMFDVPMASGRAWSATDDAARARVVVLSRGLAERLFGQSDPVGRPVHLGGADFRVIGVAGRFDPQPKFYGDLSTEPFGKEDEYYLPLETAIELNLEPTSSFASWGAKGDGNEMMRPGVTWLQLWVRLADEQDVRAYKAFLNNYWSAQHASGRFERVADARLTPLNEWLGKKKVVPRDLKLQLALAVAFLLVCMANIVGLLFAKFLRRSGEVAVRRALGAKRRDIFFQFCAEAVAIGLAGGCLGLALAELGLWTIRQQPDEYAHLASMDLWTLCATFVLAVVASLLSAAIPAARASRVEPALQIKVSE